MTGSNYLTAEKQPSQTFTKRVMNSRSFFRIEYLWKLVTPVIIRWMGRGTRYAPPPACCSYSAEAFLSAFRYVI
jgi:hypothetical protein